MTSYNINKLAGAILWSALVIVGSKVLIEEISIPKHPEKPGYVVEIPGAKPADKGHGEQASTAKPGAGGSATAKPDAATEKVTLGSLLRSGDAGRGAKVAKRCAGCHTFNKGGALRSGPNLFGIVDRAIAGVGGFNYSPALKGKGGKWTFADLKCFLENPKACVPGTKMSFRGLKKPGQLADLIVYLNGQSDSPAGLPK